MKFVGAALVAARYNMLAKLADMFDVDLEKAVLEKIEILKKRHNL